MKLWLLVYLAVLAPSQTRSKSNDINNCHGKYVCESEQGKTYKCIDRNKLCDGKNDCPRAEDEMHCDCPPLSNPDRGFVDHTQGVKVGATAKFYCDGGYTIVGSNTRTCQAGGLWSGTSPTCMKGIDCDDNKKPVSVINMPVVGGIDVLPLLEYLSSVVPMTWVAIYEVVSDSSVKLPHLNSWIGQFIPTAQGTFNANITTDGARGNATCRNYFAEYVSLNDEYSIFYIDEKDDSRDDSFEILLSSCPDEYLWRFVCTDFSALKSGRCPRDQSYLQLIVKESDLKTSSENLPWASIESDLMYNTDNTVMGYCRPQGLEYHFLQLGDCKIIPTPREEPNPGSP